MPRWFARDNSDQLGVFIAEHLVPAVVRDRSEDDLDLTLDISRLLRIENRPVRGVHARARAGDLQMIGSLASVRGYAEIVESVTDDVLFASFARPKRGRDAGFMPGIRTFGTGEAEEPSALERAHAAGLCGGCVIDRASDDLDESRLQNLGFFVYECDEEQETLHRQLVPSTPLLAARIGKLVTRCLRYGGELAKAEQLKLGAFKRPDSK